MSWQDEIKYYLKNRCDLYTFLSEHYFQIEYMYHLSPARFNLLAWYHFDGLKVLEINSECGAISEPLREKVKELTIYETNKAKREICLMRVPDAQVLDDFHMLENYDVIIMNPPFTLEMVKEALSHASKLILIFSNPLGLAKLAGNMQYGEKEPFTLLEEGEGYSKQQIEDLLHACGVDYHFYYPYPDHLFTKEIYSDQYLPRVGDLYGYSYDYTLSKQVSFDENKVRNQILKLGMFPMYSNSYLVEVDGNVVL